MSFSVFDSPLYAALLGDAELAALFADEAEIAAMIRVEAALAGVHGRLGVIPAWAARDLEATLASITIPAADLAKGLGADGVAAPALVVALRRAIGGEAAAFLHWGATSQDIADLGLLLRLKSALEIIETRLEGLISALADLAQAHRATPCVARTRSQQAAPTLFGLKAANWLAPLLRHRDRLIELRPRLLAVQLGGAAGTLAALGSHGIATMDALADALGLARAEPWHAARDRLEELAGLLTMLTGSLGKMGADLVSLAQSEVSEIRFAGAGGSSTLPQKQNPIVAELLVTLARFNAHQVGGVHQGAIHPNERDGVAWTLEWLAVPPMLAATGVALRHAASALATLIVDPAQMRANLEASNGMVLAEAASFALAAHLPREAAQALIQQAVMAATQSGRHLIDEIAGLSEAPVDWASLRDPLTQLGNARQLIDRIVARVHA